MRDDGDVAELNGEGGVGVSSTTVPRLVSFLRRFITVENGVGMDSTKSAKLAGANRPPSGVYTAKSHTRRVLAEWVAVPDVFSLPCPGLRSILQSLYFLGSIRHVSPGGTGGTLALMGQLVDTGVPTCKESASRQ